MSEALHFKYRPKTFDEVVGNKAAIEMLQSILDRDIKDMPRTFLFIGESGTGKTTLARIMKTELECSDADFHEYNASNTRGIDTIREIQHIAQLSPMKGKVKIFLMDEFHQMTKPAMEASLKLLEDAPKNTFFFLATTNPEKLLKAIKTRCTTIKTSLLPTKTISKYILEIAEKEGVDDFPKSVASAIAKASQGSCREAVKLLDQVIDIEDEETALEAVESSLGNESEVIELCRALLNGDPWKTVSKIIKGIDADPESVRLQVLGYFGNVVLGTEDLRPAEIAECFMENYYDSGRTGLIISCRQACTI